MPAVLVTGPTVTQDPPFFLAVATANTHFCLPTEGWLRLSRPGCPVWYWYGIVGFNIPLDTLWVISQSILRVR